MKRRSFKADTAALEELRIKQGLSVVALAKAATLSPRTIDSLMNGKPAFLSTFEKLAKPLQVQSGRLIQSDEKTLREDRAIAPSPDAPPPVGYVRFEFKLEAPANRFDETALVTFFANLATGINAINSAVLVNTRAGSVIITVDMTETDGTKLIDRYFDQNCKLYGVTHIKILKYQTQPESTVQNDLQKALNQRIESSRGSIFVYSIFFAVAAICLLLPLFILCKELVNIPMPDFIPQRIATPVAITILFGIMLFILGLSLLSIQEALRIRRYLHSFSLSE